MDEQKKRGLALSGGGFRATLFHLGVIRYLYDLEKAAPETKALSGITHITAVSGGSVIAAHLVLNWERYNGSEEEFASVAGELVRFIKKDVRGRILRRIPLLFPVYWASVFLRRTPLLDENTSYPWTRVSTTDLLQRYYSKYLFHDKKLLDLEPHEAEEDEPEPRPRPFLYLLTTTLDPPSQAAFTPHGFHGLNTNSVFREYNTSTHDLGFAVAASSAFPGMFTSINYQPRANGSVFKLVDGGVYDNLGVRKFWQLIDEDKEDIKEVLVSDASVRFKPADRRTYLELITTPLRSADILFKRVYEFEKEFAEQANKVDKRCDFTFLRLRDILKGKNKQERDKIRDALLADYQEELQWIRTDLDKFSDLEIAALVRQGYSVAKAKLSTTIGKDIVTPKDDKIWDPVPNSTDKLVREMIGRKATFSSKIGKALRKSAIRRYRFFAFSDAASWATIFVVILLGYGALSLYDYSKDRSQTIDNLAKFATELPPKLREIRSKRHDLLEKRIEKSATQNNSATPVRKPERSEKRDLLQEMLDAERDAKSLYAISKTEEHPSKFAAKALNLAFNAERDSADGKRDKSLSDSRNFATPALWSLAALASILQDEELGDEDRQKLNRRIDSIFDYLNENLYLISIGDEVSFSFLDNRITREESSAYVTSLALLSSIELQRANLRWHRKDPDVLATGMLKWLNEHYSDEIHSWRAIDENSGNMSYVALNLQIMSIVLETYAQKNKGEVPDYVKLRVNHLLNQLDDSAIKGLHVQPIPVKVMSLQFGTGKDDEAILENVVLNLHNKAWAIRFLQLWLAEISKRENTLPEEKLRILQLIDEYAVYHPPSNEDQGATAEFLIGLAEIDSRRNETVDEALATQAQTLNFLSSLP